MTPGEYADDRRRAWAPELVDLRELCEGVAQELERLACHGQTDPAGFLARAARIRARPHAL